MKKSIIIIFLAMGLLFASLSNINILTNTGKTISFNKMIKNIEKNSAIVFIGEKHNDPKAHLIEFEVLQALYKETKGNIIFSLEMFERDVQNILDKYLKGEIDEKSFLESSRPWPNYKTDYRPLIEFAKKNGIKVIAANIPRKYAAVVSHGDLKALDKLKPEERKFIAKKIYTEYPKYRKNFYKVMEMMTGKMKKHGVAKMKELFYRAQCAKDSTMAESILRVHKKYPNKLILHINGEFHSDYKLGTAAVLKTLCPKLKIMNIRVFPENNYKYDKKDEKIADYIIY
jgi:uncharacterized iron-regulated protein